MQPVKSGTITEVLTEFCLVYKTTVEFLYKDVPAGGTCSVTSVELGSVVSAFVTLKPEFCNNFWLLSKFY